MRAAVTRVKQLARDFKGKFSKGIIMTEEELKTRSEELDARELAIMEREQKMENHDSLLPPASEEEIHPAVIAEDDPNGGIPEHLAKWTEGRLPGDKRVKICLTCGKTVAI